MAPRADFLIMVAFRRCSHGVSRVSGIAYVFISNSQNSATNYSPKTRELVTIRALTKEFRQRFVSCFVLEHGWQSV